MTAGLSNLRRIPKAHIYAVNHDGFPAFSISPDVDIVAVAGSIPAAPTILFKDLEF